jgi:hypothetical protein
MPLRPPPGLCPAATDTNPVAADLVDRKKPSIATANRF